MLKKKTPILLHALQTLIVLWEGGNFQNSKLKSHFNLTMDENNETRWCVCTCVDKNFCEKKSSPLTK